MAEKTAARLLRTVPGSPRTPENPHVQAHAPVCGSSGASRNGSSRRRATVWGTAARLLRTALWAAVLAAGVPGFLSAEEGSHGGAPAGPRTLVSEGAWDWEKGLFTLTLRAPLPTDTEATPPRRRFLAEQEAQRRLQEEFVRQAGALPVASGRTLAETVSSDPALGAEVAQVGEALTFVSSRVDPDYTTLEMVWSASLWTGLGPVFGEAPEPNPVPPLVRWAPSREFSGLVVFAMGDLPWVGTGLQARWSPSLRFRLLSPQGEVVFDPSMTDPAFFRRWGQAGTSLGRFNEDRWRDRIGFDPLRIVARGVWGARAGDLVLAQGDWDRILSVEANRRLLAEGRVLILYGPFPDYTVRPNPDSAIDLEQPPVEEIPQRPVEKPAAAPAAHGGE